MTLDALHHVIASRPREEHDDRTTGSAAIALEMASLRIASFRVTLFALLSLAEELVICFSLLPFGDARKAPA